MPHIKLVFGATIAVLSVAALAAMIISKAMQLVIPNFMQKNRFEIMLLLAVSCIMGIVLMLI